MSMLLQDESCNFLSGDERQLNVRAIAGWKL